MAFIWLRNDEVEKGFNEDMQNCTLARDLYMKWLIWHPGAIDGIFGRPALAAV